MYLLHWNSWLLSKRGDSLQMHFSKTKLQLKINAHCFSEYRELKEVFSDMFINACNPLFWQRPVNCLLPLATVTVGDTKILDNVLIQVIYIFKWIIIKILFLTNNSRFSVSTLTYLWFIFSTMYKVGSKLATVLFTSDCWCIVMNNFSQTPSDLRQKMGLAAQRFLISISNSECLLLY